MDILREAGAIVFVFGLLGCLFFFGRRGGWVSVGLARARTANRRMQLMESLRLGPNAVIHLVRVDQRTLVISVHAAGCAVLRQEETNATHEALRNGRD